MFLIFIYVSIPTVFLAFINLRAFAIQCRQALIFFFQTILFFMRFSLKMQIFSLAYCLSVCFYYAL